MPALDPVCAGYLQTRGRQARCGVRAVSGGVRSMGETRALWSNSVPLAGEVPVIAAHRLAPRTRLAQATSTGTHQLPEIGGSPSLPCPCCSSCGDTRRPGAGSLEGTCGQRGSPRAHRSGFLRCFDVPESLASPAAPPLSSRRGGTCLVVPPGKPRTTGHPLGPRPSGRLVVTRQSGAGLSRHSSIQAPVDPGTGRSSRRSIQPPVDPKEWQPKTVAPTSRAAQGRHLDRLLRRRCPDS